MAALTTTEVIPATPAHTRAIVSGYVCDFCKAEVKIKNHGYTLVEGAQLKRVSRAEFAGGGTHKRWIVDCCAQCWDTKVTTWLKSQGIEPRCEDRSW